MTGKKGFGGGMAAPAVGVALTAAPVQEAALPSAGTVLQAGAFGAALGGVTTGLADTVRLRDGEITRDEAVRDVAKASLSGAASMAVAATAAHVARARPVLGLGLLAVAGLGLLISSKKKKKPATAAEPPPAV